MQSLITLLVTVTLAEMMFAMGLRLSFSQLLVSLGRARWFLIKAFIANYLVIPFVTLLVIRLFHLPPAVAVGLLILGVSPAAPYALPFTILARGNLAVSTGLMVLLAGTSAFMAPLLLHITMPYSAGEQAALVIDPVRLSGTLFFIQLLPLCLGLAVGQWRPGVALRMEKPAGLLSKVLNGAMITAIAILQFGVLTSTDSIMFLILALPVIAGLLTGWMLGGPERKNRISLSVMTAMRNMSLSMAIAATSFGGTEAVTTILVYSFVAGSGVLAVAALYRKFS